MIILDNKIMISIIVQKWIHETNFSLPTCDAHEENES